MTPVDDIFGRFAVALGVGLLVGLERGWKTRGEASGSRTAGVRTFALIGLLGGVVGALGRSLPSGTAAGLVIGLCLAAFSAAFAMLCREENRADGTYSATTAVAGMVTFALGAYALVGDVYATVAAGVAATSLLALREGLHQVVAHITWRELRAGLVLLTMTFIALPLLPGEPLPVIEIDVRRVWIIAIVLAVVSFTGYVLVKVFGATRGLLLAGAAGGLVSSTAVMIENARRAREGGPQRLLAAGAMLATAVSIGRTEALVLALNVDLGKLLAAPLAVGGAVACVVALVLALNGVGDVEERPIGFRNPFELRAVIGFALLLGVVLVASRVVSERYGEAAAVVAAVAVGLADVDSVAATMAQLAPATLGTNVAALALLAAIASNTISKSVIGTFAGGGRFGLYVAVAHAAILAAGAGLAAATGLL